MPPFSFSSVNTHIGQRNSDGTIDIKCRLCGRFIKRSLTKFIAICITCETDKVPVDRLPQEEDELISLYTPEEMATVKLEDKAGFVRTMFRALGLRRFLPPPVPKKSQAVAKAKARKKLFSSKDEEIVTLEKDEE